MHILQYSQPTEVALRMHLEVKMTPGTHLGLVLYKSKILKVISHLLLWLATEINHDPLFL